MGYLRRRCDISRFICRVMLFCLPLMMVAVAYVWLDPFKVVWHYDTFYPRHHASGIGLNAGYVGTANFDSHRSDMHYDSFIFGNSRSVYYEVDDWLPHLPAGSVPYHFDASAETIKGIEQKVKYISGCGMRLRNALFVIDVSVLARTSPLKGHLYSTPPQLDGYGNFIKFHADFFGVFLNPKFAFAVADYSLCGKVRNYMLQSNMLSDEDFDYDYRYNECRNTLYERQMADGKYFDDKRIAVFAGVQHPDSVSEPVIGAEQKELLQSIEQVLAAHGTDCRVVISPLYDQIRISPDDVAVLKSIFGAKRVFDFSGQNAYNADFHNYYEQSHYRPVVARDIMNRIYRQNP